MVYAVDFSFSECTLIFLRRKPRVWLAVFVTLLMCVVQERSFDMSTPRYFADVVDPSSMLCRWYVVLMGVRDFVIWMT